MSIIERAIDKLDGVNEPEQANPRTAEQASSIASTSVEVKESVGRDNSVDQLKSDANDGTVSRIPVTNDENAVSLEEQPEPSIQGERADLSKRNGELHIDLERLVAAGFLTPDAGITSQSEEYQQIKRRLLANAELEKDEFNGRPNLVMVTSSVPSEGKTFTSVNLAMSLATEIDRTVLVVDTDIAKKDLTRSFGALNRPGIFDLLSDDSIDLADIMLATNIPNLVIIPAGLESSVSTERLASIKMQEISAEISGRYADRIIIYDTPPVLASSAAAALAPQTGQIILVVEAGKTKQETLDEALQKLEGIHIAGLVLNKSKQFKRSSYDYYGYYYRPPA